MKKIILFPILLACGIMFAACGNDKDTTAKSSSTTETASSTTVTESVSTSKTENSSQGSVIVQQSGSSEEIEQVATTTPEAVRGSWTATNDEGQIIDFIITDNQLITDGTIYDITSFNQEGNQYVLFWDDSNVSPGVNPQAFMYTYLPDTDQLDSGYLIYSRK